MKAVAISFKSLGLAFGGLFLSAGLALTQQAEPIDKEMDLPLERPVKVEKPKEKTEGEKPKTGEFMGKPIHGDKIVFVIDRSGSMDWDVKAFTDGEGRPRRGNRMDRAKAALAKAISKLDASAKFNIVSYECDISKWRNGGLHDANSGNKSNAIGWANRLVADGGTMTGPGTAEGLRISKDVNVVILLTDGAPNCGANGNDGHKSVIKRANQQRARIDVFGIGVDGGEFRRFLQGVANENGGSYTEVQ